MCSHTSEYVQHRQAGARGRQKRALGPLEMELQVACEQLNVGEGKSGLQPEQQEYQLLRHRSNRFKKPFCPLLQTCLQLLRYQPPAEGKL